jgi:hypothetical protein
LVVASRCFRFGSTIVPAQDLPLIDRATDEKGEAAEILAKWIGDRGEE